MLEELQKNLLDARKNLEKGLIQNFVASQSHATSENRKQMMARMEAEKVAGIKRNGSNYTKNLSTSAKGKWVDKAKQAFKETTEQLDKQ